jgi:hypothetical protein
MHLVNIIVDPWHLTAVARPVDVACRQQVRPVACQWYVAP